MLGDQKNSRVVAAIMKRDFEAAASGRRLVGDGDSVLVEISETGNTYWVHDVDRKELIFTLGSKRAAEQYLDFDKSNGLNKAIKMAGAELETILKVRKYLNEMKQTPIKKWKPEIIKAIHKITGIRIGKSMAWREAIHAVDEWTKTADDKLTRKVKGLNGAAHHKRPAEIAAKTAPAKAASTRQARALARASARVSARQQGRPSKVNAKKSVVKSTPRRENTVAHTAFAVVKPELNQALSLITKVERKLEKASLENGSANRMKSLESDLKNTESRLREAMDNNARLIRENRDLEKQLLALDKEADKLDTEAGRYYNQLEAMKKNAKTAFKLIQGGKVRAAKKMVKKNAKKSAKKVSKRRRAA